MTLGNNNTAVGLLSHNDVTPHLTPVISPSTHEAFRGPLTINAGPGSSLPLEPPYRERSLAMEIAAPYDDSDCGATSNTAVPWLAGQRGHGRTQSETEALRPTMSAIAAQQQARPYHGWLAGEGTAGHRVRQKHGAGEGWRGLAGEAPRCRKAWALTVT